MTTEIIFKEQIPLTRQERSNAAFHAGCKMFSWSCNDNAIKNFLSIEFDNEYTAFLSIKIKQHAEDEWHVLLKRYRLMESSHGEPGSNSHIILDQKQFIFMPRSIYQICFFLQQPSPIWKDFSIDNVKIHNQTSLSKDSPNSDKSGIFYYCLLAARNKYSAPYNPYDLEIQTNEIEVISLPYFWTVSAFNITYVNTLDSSQTTITPALVWLWERYQYNYLTTQLSCFSNFRKWRAFRCWWSNVQAEKRERTLSIHNRKLFYANEIFQGVLIHVKAMCEVYYYGQTDRIKPFCLLDRHVYQQTSTLEEFSRRHFAQMNATSIKLREFIDQIAILAVHACEKAVELEGISVEALADPSLYQQPVEFDEDEQISQYDTQQSRTSIKTKAKLNIGPSFAERKRWRDTLIRISDFLRLLDYIILEFLRRLVKSCVRDLLIHVRESFCVEFELAHRGQHKDDDEDNDGQSRYAREKSMLSTRSYRPKQEFPAESRASFHTDPTTEASNNKEQNYGIQTVLRSENLEKDDLYSTIEPNDILDLPRLENTANRIPPPMFEINLLLKFFQLPRHNTSDLDDEASSDSFSESKDRVTYEISPNEYDFKNATRDIINGLEKCVGQVPSLRDHPTLNLFCTFPNFDASNPLSRTPIHVSKAHWPDVLFLFGDDADHQEVIIDILSTVNQALANVQSFIKRYQKHCDMVLSCTQLKIEEKLKQKELTTDDIHFLMTKHTHQLLKMEQMIVQQRVGLIFVKADQFYNATIPYPKHIINTIGEYLPPVAVEKNERMQRTIRDVLKLLDRDPRSVEDFVQHLATLNTVNSDLTKLDHEFQIISKMFDTIKDFSMNIAPEDYSLFRSLAPIYQQLKSSLLYTEAQCDENVQKFTIELDEMIQRLHTQIIELKTKSKDSSLLASDTRPETALEIILILQESLAQLNEKAKNYTTFQERFNQISKNSTKKRILGDYQITNKYRRQDVTISLPSLYTELTDIEQDINLRKLLWESQQNWTKLYREWTNTVLDAIDIDLLQKEVSKFTQNIYILEKALPPNDIIPKLKERLIEFKASMPIILALRNPNMKKRHFDRLRVLIGKDIIDDEYLKLNKLLRPDILQLIDKITDVSSLASNETALETMLNKIIERWRLLDFRLLPHAGKDTFIIVGYEDILQQLEESQITMSTIKSSKYINPIRQLVDEWDKRLTLLSKTIDEWITCQRRWLYLEQIFSTPDIQLTQETKIFSQVDKQWKELMRRTEQLPNALKSATQPGTLELLQTNNLQMEKIQRALEDYLETKRLAFPRLFFLSNEDLLDILSHANDANCVQPHLRKCFANIFYLRIVKSPVEVVTSMQSVEGEVVNFTKSIRPRGVVEQWLTQVEQAMYDAVKVHLKVGLADIKNTDFIEWILKHPSQIVLTISQVMYTQQVNQTFDSPSTQIENTLIRTRDQMITTIKNVCALVFTQIEQTKLLTVEALLTLQVHWRDIFEILIKQHIRDKNDFEWQKHLRYEWNDTETNFQLLQGDASFPYGYEYLGCCTRLVVTPLTDRCYLTLTGAIKLNLGGAPSGPAGTGKTETVKDLSKSFGKLCLVFNCSDELDHKTLGKMFSGLVQSGSWCCFDEFNRIDVEVLSVVAQQLLTIKTAKDSHAQRFAFDGREIKMNPSCGFFVTMNPTYSGRVELPDNLKPMFRPIAMMIPHYSLIGEVILFSVGFTSAKVLATKIVYLYNLSNSQLSQQDHYDFGMRAIKAVLLTAGELKRSHIKDPELTDEQSEENIMLQALTESNLPKLLKDDATLFLGILRDLFPQSDKSLHEHITIEQAIQRAIRDLNYEYWPAQADKALQLYNQIVLRHGTMLVGGAGGGKTTVRNILQRALTYLPTLVKDETQTKQNRLATVDVNVLNPKSMQISELYGAVNPDTLEFTDGMLATIMRSYSKSHESQINTDKNESYVEHWQWLVLDGPIDTLWVENLNTLLDDSKILCLANGERIGMSGHTRILFEVDSLVNSSPATVTRCAMVYFDPIDLGYVPFLNYWYRCKLPAMFPESAVNFLYELMDFSLDKGYFYYYYYYFLFTMKKLFIGFAFLDSLKDPWHMPVSRINVLQTFCSLLSTFLNYLDKHGGFGEDDQRNVPAAANNPPKPHTTKQFTQGDELVVYVINDKKQYYLQKNPKNIRQCLLRIYIFCYVWSFGGGLKREDNFEDDNLINQKEQIKAERDPTTQEFDTFVRDLFGANINYSVYLPPDARMIFDYMIDLNTYIYHEWDSLVPKTEQLIKSEQSHFVIPTVDIVRYSFLITAVLIHKVPVLLTGNSGVGKTLLIEAMLRSLTLPDGNFVRPGTIIGDVLEFNAARGITASKLAQTSDVPPETTKADALQSLKIQMSAQTTPNKLVNQITGNLIKKKGNLLGCQQGKWLLIFIDDLNIPQVDSFGDQPTLETLRYILQTGSAIDAKKNQIRPISDLTFLAACDSPSSGRLAPSKRLLQSFSIFALPDPAAKQLFHIYSVRLGRFLNSLDFPQDVRSSLYLLVSACLVMYYRVSINILPTPSKVHYIFNLRDLAKLAQGIMQASTLTITNQEDLSILFAHECLRVFADRLVTENDLAIFYKHLNATTNSYFKISLDISNYSENPLLFCNFLKSDDRLYQQLNDWRQCCPVFLDYQMKQALSGQSTLKMVFFKEAVEHVIRICRVLQQPGGHLLLIGLDGTGRRTCLELSALICGHSLFQLNIKRGYAYTEFRDDLKIVFKAVTVQNRPMALFIQEKDLLHDSFIEDIESILNSGTVVDLFEADEFNALVMDLKNDAYAANMSDTPAQLQEFFYQRVRTNLHIILSFSPAGSKFREICRLHPALLNCTSIDWFTEWSETSMVQVADVFLEIVDLKILSSNHEHIDDKELHHRLALCCVSIHEIVVEAAKRFYAAHKRHYYLTPSSYMDLMKAFDKMMTQTKQEFLTNYNRLSTGLLKLSDANASVSVMRDELALLGPQIDEKEKEIEQLLNQLQKDQKAVLEVKEIVEIEEQKIHQDTDMVERYATQAELDLKSVEPVLEEAMADVSQLDKADVAEVRVYQSPPYGVMMVMCAVCVLLECKSDWATARQVLGDSGFISRLTNLDINNISDRTYRKLLQYSRNPEFTPDLIGKVSSACRSICKWVLAIQRYYEVYRTVKPKEEKVKTANEALSVMQKSLSRKQEMLKLVKDHLQELEDKYNNSVNEKQALYARRELMKQRMSCAHELTNVLAIEKVRWQEQVTQLEQQVRLLIGDALLSASAINYFGPFNSEFRHDLMRDFQKILSDNQINFSSNYKLSTMLSTTSEIRNWISQLLPDDECSIENAVLVKHCIKWPLLIDPQRQAIQWIRTKETENNLRVVSADDTTLLRVCEQCIRLGLPLIIEGVGETIESSLLPLLNRDIFNQKNSSMGTIRFNDIDIEFNPNFRVYFITQLNNPHFLPDICIRVTLINFTITQNGLEHQLLSLVVLNEEPHLEHERKLLLETLAQDLKSLRDYEDRTLEMLTSSEQHLLDRNDLIDILTRAKITSDEIASRVSENESNERQINIARECYLSLAKRGSLLYFLINYLSRLNVMYQFSLTWFQRTFLSCILDRDTTRRMSMTNLAPDVETVQRYMQKRRRSSVFSLPLQSPRRSFSEESPDDTGPPPVLSRMRRNTKHFIPMVNPQQRTATLRILVDRLTYTIYQLVSWSLFAEHQLLFSFLLTTAIEREAYNERHITRNPIPSNIIHEDEQEETVDENEQKMKLSFITQDEWTCFMSPLLNNVTEDKLVFVNEQISSLYPICLNLLNDADQQFFKHSNPYMYLTQHNDYCQLTRFRCLLIIKILRPDTLLPSISQYVSEQMGSKFLSSGFANIQDIYAHSSPQAPIILLLSPGTDPTSLLIRFARETRGTAAHLDVISLGQGQGPKVEEVLSKALTLKGRWIFLHNCHLSASFMPRLRVLVNNFNKPGLELDSQFRLFLSSKPDVHFPLELLQLGLKMTVEWPRGLKSSLLQTFAPTGIVNEKVYEKNTLGPYWRRLVFNLAFFHAVIHERKKFGALGWNLSYEFNQSDLEVAVLELESLVRRSKNQIPPFDVFCYLAGSVIYGGRVTDEFDRRRLLRIIERFYCPETLEEDYSYAGDETYKAPSLDLNFSNLLSYINALPDFDDPRVFGMHPNTNRALMYVQANELVDMLVTIEPQYRMMISFGASSDGDAACMHIIDDITSKVPRSIETGFGATGRHLKFENALLKINTRLENKYHAYSVFFSLLKQEIRTYNELLELIYSTCDDLRRALVGETVVSEILEETQRTLLMHEVPMIWKRKSYPSTKSLRAWITDLLGRITFFKEWTQQVIIYVEDNKVLSPLPAIFNTAAFYYPKGLFSAILQSSARSMALPIDQLKFTYKVLDNDEERQQLQSTTTAHDISNGIIIDGIYLDGAQWDYEHHEIVDCTNQQRSHRLPPLLCKLIPKNNETIDSTNVYECPVYLTALRAVSANEAAKHLVSTITIPCSETESFWTTRSIAGILEVNE
ncbi:unnamed protein product [Adineta steineri]|uniref:AAA+ ATPase domain-containing protein n=1 Tax=Adineta steineri TaxID=433720 RepID=A0A814FLT2_9BILA|nr:unnamed protein product [Adineta steineri]